MPSAWRKSMICRSHCPLQGTPGRRSAGRDHRQWRHGGCLCGCLLRRRWCLAMRPRRGSSAGQELQLSWFTSRFFVEGISPLGREGRQHRDETLGQAPIKSCRPDQVALAALVRRTDPLKDNLGRRRWSFESPRIRTTSSISVELPQHRAGQIVDYAAMSSGSKITPSTASTTTPSRA